MLLGLDNTLIDRTGAFAAWGSAFLHEIGAPEHDIDWLLSVDADGMSSPWDVAEAIRDRYRLRAPIIDLVDEVRDGELEYVRFDPLVGCALTITASAGWVPVVVANGETYQQQAKLQRLGLDRYVADWVISEEAGVSKPNPRIFAIAADRVGLRLGGAWLVGDSPEADIGGAVAIGIPSVWLHRGRHWHSRGYAPTREADSVIGALAMVVAAR